MSTDFLEENEKKVLELETRRKIFEIVKTSAGSHFREITRKSGLPATSVRYHLHYMVSKGLLTETKEGGLTRYFPKHVTNNNKELLGLLRQKSIRHILIFLLHYEPCTHKEITQGVNLSPSTVSWHLKKLQEKRIIEQKERNYLLTLKKQELINVLITYKESFLDKLVDRAVEMWE